MLQVIFYTFSMNHFTVSVPFILFLGLHYIPVSVWNGMVRRNIWSKGKGMFIALAFMSFSI